MSLRNYGTNRPIDTGGLLRRGVVLLAALLLVCTLMAGAVSAEDVTGNGTASDPFVVSEFTALKEKLEAGKYVKLKVDMTGNQAIIIKNGNTSVLDLNGMTLTLTGTDTHRIQVGNLKTTGQMDNDVSSGTLTVTDSSASPGEINATQQRLFFVGNKSTLTLEKGNFKASVFVIGGDATLSTDKKYHIYGNPTVNVKPGVTITSTEDTAVFFSAEGSKATFDDVTINGVLGGLSLAAGDITVKDTKISVTGNSPKPARYYPTESGSIDDGSAIGVHKKGGAYHGDLTVQILGSTNLKSVDGFALNNYIRESDPGTTKVVIADTVTREGKIASAFYRTKGTGSNPDTIQVAEIAGSFVDTSGNILLYPGLNQTGVKWTGDATNGYTLAISESGSYKLMESFKYADYNKQNRINIDGITVTLDLNGKEISATATEDGKTNAISFIAITKKDSTIGSLTVTGNGKITIEGPYMFYAMSESALTIKSGTFTATGGTVAAGNGLNADTKMIISGGTLISTGTAPVVFMPSTQTLIINGTAKLSGPVGLDAKTGTITISENAVIEATGTGTGASTDCSDGPVEGESSAIVLERTDSYKGDLALTIKDNAQIISKNGAAIRNYIRDKDLTYKTTGNTKYQTPAITIEGNAKLSGNAAVIENRKYTTGQSEEVVGTFNLNGGYYKFTGTTGVLLQDVAPTYQDGKVMSDTPVNDGYYAPITVTKPEPPITTPTDGKSITVNTGSEPTTEGNVVTVTPSADTGVTLILTYDDGVTPTISNNEITAASAPTEVKAEYPETAAANSGTFLLSVAINDVTAIDDLPTISTEINTDAKKKLETEQGMNLVSMVTVDVTKLKSESKLKELTLVFKVPKSLFAGKDLGSVHAYHFDGTTLADQGPVTAVSEGDSYVFTITADVASPWMLGVKTSSGSSSSGNTNNAFRVLFDTSGGSYVSPATGLSYGDKISQPANPVKDGYTFGGWYKDAACTQSWSFSDSIPGDMTLYAKWTSSSGTEATATQTTQTTAKATPAQTQAQQQSGTTATTAAPVATTAAGAQPTLTQAPAPVLGGLFGLLAAGILLRRRE